MDENLFNVAAKLKADRKRVERSGPVIGGDVKVDVTGRRARQLAAFGAALLVNAAVLGLLQWSAYTARPVPAGQVVITQLDTDLETRVASN